MYALYAQIYWPVWLLFDHFGHTWLGMFIGVLVVVVVWAVAWRCEFPVKGD